MRKGFSVMKKTYKFDKLIRDRIYTKMLNQNSVVRLKQISKQSQLLYYYKTKLVEESNEASFAQSEEGLVEELADIVEIIHGIAYVLRTDFEAIEKVRLSKRQTDGGFVQGIIVDTVQIEEENELAPYYDANYEQISTEP